MGYRPGYFESFVGIALCGALAIWLERRGFPWVRWLVLGAMVAVAVGMVVGAGFLATDGDIDDPRLVAAQWVPFGVVGAALLVELVLGFTVAIRQS